MGQFIAAIMLTILFLALLKVRQTRRMKKYWHRHCTGTLWKRVFPEASKEEIREFLCIFVDAFVFKPTSYLKFDPQDRVMDVYKALYPSATCDNMELETLAMSFEAAYGIAFPPDFSEETTLAHLFKLAQEGIIKRRQKLAASNLAKLGGTEPQLCEIPRRRPF